MTEPNDSWNAASAYEHFMGRWSRILAGEFVRWLDAPAGQYWLDVGCGTGSLASAILEIADPAAVVACDPSEAFIASARTNVNDARIEFSVAGVDELPLRAKGFDLAVSLLALNFFPDPERGVRSMSEAVSPGGTVAACVWDYADGMEFLRVFWDTAITLDPNAAEFDEGARFPICAREPLIELFRSAGLVEVICEPIEIETVFASFEDYWDPFLGATGPAPAYLASLDTKKQEEFRDAVGRSLTVASDGSIHLRARAWPVRGSKPV